jgi:AraC family transcriptional regulator
MKMLSRIPLIQSTTGEVLRGNPFANVVLSSACMNWPNLVLEEHHFPKHELDNVMYVQHVIAMNVGPTICCDKTGCFPLMTRRTVYLTPSHQPFHIYRGPRSDSDGPADVLYVALDPIFVGQTAEELELYPDRVELVERRRETDPALRHIVMALRAGLQSGHAADRLYGESLSTALAVHLLREYAGRSSGLEHVHRGLSREQLLRALAYIHDQLHADLTVAGIARTVHMSPYHFARLFKKATGKSPYRYVVETRTKRARELLTSGKFSISEIAHQVGFADQSHLTHHVKNFFGVTPKMLLKGRS